MIRRSTPRTPPPQDCPLDQCLKFLSSTWTTRILWFLDCGPRRFGDLRRDLGSISSKVLAQRLRALEARRLVQRRALAGSPPQVEYELTTFGREFRPVLAAMVEVAERIRERIKAQ